MLYCEFFDITILCCNFFNITERDDLQDVEHLKRIAPPPTAQTVRAIGLIFGLGILWRDISGATVAIFEFPS